MTWNTYSRGVAFRTYHNGKNQAGGGGLDGPQHHEAEELDSGEQVNAVERNAAQEDQVGLMLHRDEDDLQPVEELQQQVPMNRCRFANNMV